MEPNDNPYEKSSPQEAAFYSKILSKNPAIALSRSVHPSRPASLQSRTRSVIVSYIERPPPKQKRFKSARLRGEYEKPWLYEPDPRAKYDKIIFWGLAFVGCAIGACICWEGWRSVSDQNYCLVFEDDFQNGINPDSWNHEVQTGGFGAGSFDWTTTDPLNSYADKHGLHIVPTITTDVTDITEGQLLDGYSLNLTTDGTCTSVVTTACSLASNSTDGTIINPVRSARLNTKGKQSLLYGKVEVVAKLPKGDWLWPAIWMMPEEETYGEWPASGEIDLMESRGNDGSIYDDGRNAVSGTIHWGPKATLDMFWSTTGKKTMKRGDFSKSFHTFGVEWSQDYIFTYVDSLLVQSIYMPFGKAHGYLYDRGQFADMDINGSAPVNSWASSSAYNAPFDKPFYLILNVAVGTTNGYFPDGYGAKPWMDKEQNSPLLFWKARNAWEPTWGKGDTRGMTVKSVRMFKPGKCTPRSPRPA